ncbi:unnamed protein product, partial [marine sediment metagenome]
VMFPWTVTIGAYPGQTTTATIYCRSIIPSAPTYDITYSISTDADLNYVSTTWTLDGETWTPSQSYPLDGGQTHELDLTLSIPLEEVETAYNFWIYPIRTDVAK